MPIGRQRDDKGTSIFRPRRTRGGTGKLKTCRHNPATPLGHKVGQNAKTCGFSRWFCHCGRIARYGSEGYSCEKMLDVPAQLASGHFSALARRASQVSQMSLGPHDGGEGHGPAYWRAGMAKWRSGLSYCRAGLARWVAAGHG